MSRLREPTALVAIHGNPHVERIVQTLGAWPDMYSPQLVFARNIAQRLERDRDFDRVAIARDHSFRLHDQIEAEVFTLSFSPNAVGLHAEWIEVKLVSSPLIVESVKENADVIVVKDVVALRDVCAHLGGIVETMKCDVEKTWVVAQPDFGAILRDEIVAGLHLVEGFEDGCGLPNLVVKLAVDRGWRGEKGWFYWS